MRIRNVLLLMVAALVLVACGDAAPTSTTVPIVAATATTGTSAALPTGTVAAAQATATMAVEASPTMMAAATTAPTMMAEASPTAMMAATTAPTEAATTEPAATTAPVEPTVAPTEAPAAMGEPGPMTSQAIEVPDALAAQFPEGHELTLPAGFHVSVFAAGLETPRWIVTGPDGNLWVSERLGGRILVYTPQGGDAAPSDPQVFISGLDSPHGIAFYDDWVYISETTRILRVKNVDGKASGDPEVIISGIPDGGHSTRTLLFTAEGKLLVSIGSSCNVCTESDERRAAVMIYDADGSNGRLYATGLRNAVGLATNPTTGQIWFTNNGRDNLGDNIPKEIIGTLEDGAFYGWPDCYGDKVVDTDFGGDAAKCANMKVAEVQVQAHSAPLGNTFIPESGWPAAYSGAMIVAYHGSWNRSQATGYKLVSIPMANGQPTGEATDFVTGWLTGGSDWGRPVDPAVGSDGALYVTDDSVGAIYRIYWTGQ